MNVVTSIMRQHRRIQRLHALITSNESRETGRPNEATMADLVEAVLVHASSTEELLGKIRDERVVRDVEAHRVHHSRAKLAFFRVATCPEAALARELALLDAILRDHAQHEAKVVQSLTQVFGEEVLEVLGEQMAMLEPAAPGAEPVARVARVERVA